MKKDCKKVCFIKEINMLIESCTFTTPKCCYCKQLDKAVVKYGELKKQYEMSRLQ